MSNKELNICVPSPTAVAELEVPRYSQDKIAPDDRCARQSPVPWLVCPAGSQCQQAPGPLARQVCHVALNAVMELAASPGGPKRPPWDTDTGQDLASAAQCHGSASQRCLPFSPCALSTTWRRWQRVHAVQGNLITVINHTTASLGGMKFSLHWRCSKPSTRVVAAPGGLGRGECVRSVGLSPPRAGMCQHRCGAHHHVPRATSLYPTELCGLVIVKRGQAPSRHRMVMVALQPMYTGPWFALFWDFVLLQNQQSWGALGHAPWDGGVGPGTYSEDRVGSPLRGGEPAGDGCSWGAVGTPTSPHPAPLAEAL